MPIALIGSYKFQIDFIKMYKQINIFKNTRDIILVNGSLVRIALQLF